MTDGQLLERFVSRRKTTALASHSDAAWCGTVRHSTATSGIGCQPRQRWQWLATLAAAGNSCRAWQIVSRVATRVARGQRWRRIPQNGCPHASAASAQGLAKAGGLRPRAVLGRGAPSPGTRLLRLQISRSSRPGPNWANPGTHISWHSPVCRDACGGPVGSYCKRAVPNRFGTALNSRHACPAPCNACSGPSLPNLGSLGKPCMTAIPCPASTCASSCAASRCPPTTHRELGQHRELGHASQGATAPCYPGGTEWIVFALRHAGIHRPRPIACRVRLPRGLARDSVTASSIAKGVGTRLCNRNLVFCNLL